MMLDGEFPVGLFDFLCRRGFGHSKGFVEFGRIRGSTTASTSGHAAAATAVRKVFERNASKHDCR
jgi:flavin-dependent dehydrogenase